MKKQVGISGNNVRKELLNRVSHLAVIYNNVTENIKSLEKPLQYYAKFSELVAGVPYSLPLISYLIGE